MATDIGELLTMALWLAKHSGLWNGVAKDVTVTAVLTVACPTHSDAVTCARLVAERPRIGGIWLPVLADDSNVVVVS